LVIIGSVHDSIGTCPDVQYAIDLERRSGAERAMTWTQIFLAILASSTVSTGLSLWVTGQWKHWERADELFRDLVVAWHELMNCYDQMVLGKEGKIPSGRATPDYTNRLGDDIDRLFPQVQSLGLMVKALDLDRARRDCAEVMLNNCVLADHVQKKENQGKTPREIAGAMQLAGWRALERIKPRRLLGAMPE
jgi:hypothetical protein